MPCVPAPVVTPTPVTPAASVAPNIVPINMMGGNKDACGRSSGTRDYGMPCVPALATTGSTPVPQAEVKAQAQAQRWRPF